MLDAVGHTLGGTTQSRACNVHFRIVFMPLRIGRANVNIYLLVLEELCFP